MNDEVKIRLAEEKDIQKIISLVKTSFDEAYLIASIYSCFGIEKFLNNEIKNDYSPYRYFIAEINEVVVGFAEFKMFQESSCAFLNMIATDNNFKGKGIANHIFTSAKNFFLNLGFLNIQLDVFSSNSIAKKWYFSLGFSEENTKGFYKYLETEILDENINNDILITNFSNFKCLYDYFGFSFLQLSLNRKEINIGIINKNGIFRGTLSDTVSHKKIVNLLAKKNITKIYYIGEDIEDAKFEKIDEIIRLKLDI